MDWNNSDRDRLIQAFKLADSEHLLKSFLSDLLTEKEISLCVRRFKAAALIVEGTPYVHIQWMTGLSSATISKISKQLANKKGGFHEILDKLNPYGKRYTE